MEEGNENAEGTCRGWGAALGSGRPKRSIPFPRRCGADAAAPCYYGPLASGGPIGPGAPPGPTALPARTRGSVEPAGAAAMAHLARPASGALPTAGTQGVDSACREACGGRGSARRKAPSTLTRASLCPQVAEGQELKDKSTLRYPINGAWGMGPCAGVAWLGWSFAPRGISPWPQARFCASFP